MSIDTPLKVFYWPADVESGCWMYRIDMPRRELLRLGHEVQTSQTLGPWGQGEADVIVGQRVCVTKPTAMWLIVANKRHKAGHRPMVYETDDDLFDMDDTNPSAPFFRQQHTRKNMVDAVRAADLVTVSTEPLAAVMRKRNPNVAVLPNCVRAEVLDVPAPLRRGEDDGRTFYGWQGSQTHAADWNVVHDVVTETVEANPRAYLRFLGHGYSDARLARTGRVHLKPWTGDLGEHYRRVARFDVTLAPLANTKFNESKSALRVIESLALGVPVVASDVPAYRGWVEDGVTGFLASTPAQWRDALEALRDPDLRRRMGEAGRKAAAAWTIEANISKWIDAYRTLL